MPLNCLSVRIGFLKADGVADLDGAGECFLGLDWLEGFEITQVRTVERIGPLGLRDDDARQLGDQPEVLHHQQSLAQRRDVAEIATGDDDHVRRLPIELLDDLDADGLLALDPKRIHRVGQVERRVLGDLLDQPHAAVEVGVQVEHQRAVGDGLDQLGDGNLSPRQQHDRLDAGGGAIGGQAPPKYRQSKRRLPP